SWVFDRPSAHPEGLLAAGPGLLAWFEPSGEKPAWTQKENGATATSLWAPIIPGPVTPAVANGRVFARWDLQPMVKGARAGLLPVNVAAFDLRSGTRLWTTASVTDWEELCPVNDPVYSDGKLHLLAVQRKEEYSPVFVVGLDAASGALLWKRELVSFHTTLPTPADNRQPGLG